MYDCHRYDYDSNECNADSYLCTQILTMTSIKLQNETMPSGSALPLISQISGVAPPTWLSDKKKRSLAEIRTDELMQNVDEIAYSRS